MNEDLLNEREKVMIADKAMIEVEENWEKNQEYKNGMAVVMHVKDRFNIAFADAVDTICIMKKKYSDRLQKMGYILGEEGHNFYIN
jgi:hypothetical protein